MTAVPDTTNQPVGPSRTLLSTQAAECPPSLLEKAAKCPPIRVAVVNATSALTLASVRSACEHGLIEPVFVGPEPMIHEVGDSIGWNMREFRFRHADSEHDAANFAATLAANGDASALMKGDVHTDVLMRAVLDRGAGLRTGRHMSHIFHMTLPGVEKALFITDAVLNVAPTLDQKTQILKNGISLLAALGYDRPRIALLSASESVSAAIPSTLDSAELALQARQGSFPGAIVDGPLAFDLAVSPDAARIKGMDSPVAGHADMLLVPNIEAGNALFKMMVHFLSATAAGLILGAKVPVIVTSRSDSVASRLASVALATIYTDNASQQE